MGGAEEFCRETTESAPWVSLNEQLTNPLGGLTAILHSSFLKSDFDN
ncbi:hypothetical protein H1P_860003 [Hyella patelloides LEGE 07179]|uniref:Uncharacterized protein n=1 Tax=Hyella patelloides LEGE 07179 TaxID=945734 RepID=A0A563W4V9_9CYAN|nr:hypothetical protein H1P_860003 [Hyella patelloides LEGE 07179]